jgi:hypothetical protein
MTSRLFDNLKSLSCPSRQHKQSDKGHNRPKRAVRQDLRWADGLEQRVIYRRQAPGETGQNHRNGAFCELRHAAISSLADLTRTKKMACLRSLQQAISHLYCRQGLTGDPQHFPN